jgi:hypothetical protein
MNDTAPAVPSSSRKAQAQNPWLLTSKDVADILGLSRQQVLREVAGGRLLFHAEVKRRTRTWHWFSVENVRDYCRDWYPKIAHEAETRMKERLAA